MRRWWHLVLIGSLAFPVSTFGAMTAGEGDALSTKAIAGDRSALQKLIEAAASGDAVAEAELGFMYQNGQGVPQDTKQAAEWYRKAAKQGDTLAQAGLGIMYHDGQGMEQDYKQAAEWFRKAAEQGNATAQYNLGFMYQNGQGVPLDFKQAAEWYRRAAVQGYAPAQATLGFMYEHGHGVPRDIKQAIDWYRKAAGQGDTWAKNRLGIMDQNGQGEPKDNKQAVESYRKAGVVKLAIGTETEKKLDTCQIKHDLTQSDVWEDLKSDNISSVKYSSNYNSSLLKFGADGLPDEVISSNEFAKTKTSLIWKNGRLVESRWSRISSPKKLLWTAKLTYDQNGELVAVRKTHSSDEVDMWYIQSKNVGKEKIFACLALASYGSSMHVRSYDEGGKPVYKINLYLSDDEAARARSSEETSFNYLQKVLNNYGGGCQISGFAKPSTGDHIRYEKDQGYEITTTVFCFNGQEFGKKWKKDGLVYQTAMRDGDQIKFNRYSYDFDKTGNWRKSTKFLRKFKGIEKEEKYAWVPTETETREITYRKQP